MSSGMITFPERDAWATFTDRRHGSSTAIAWMLYNNALIRRDSWDDEIQSVSKDLLAGHPCVSYWLTNEDLLADDWRIIPNEPSEASQG